MDFISISKLSAVQEQENRIHRCNYNCRYFKAWHQFLFYARLRVRMYCKPLVKSYKWKYFSINPYTGFAFVCLKIQHLTDSFQYLAVGDVVGFLLDKNL